ncbi:TIGR03618 family F420-dependent PPOX class oxidoreductase [Kribbella albertanoniae]|uniref:TIGR03618 family F420-dependent PPOX class oxidoreductase n=1 Tax=Kribbella albertanoniae TaxID=1266829 RepID=UPI00192D72E2|nr:TIGR03618 family F420-dependent PPOX class oxidoreductase [Kribbella albertanoniae]
MVLAATNLATLATEEAGLVVVSTLRADGTLQASVVNAGLLPHPITGRLVLGFATYGQVKLANLRARPQLTMTARSGWAWVTAEGIAELIGPDDPVAGVGAERLRMLLREVYLAAGGEHDDWGQYDEVMAAQRRTVVLLDPVRVYGS